MEQNSQSTLSVMNFVAGISLNGTLGETPHIDLTFLCHEDPKFHKSSQFGQQPDLQTSLKSIFDSLPHAIHDITITTPSYYTEDETQKVKRAAKAAGFRGCHWSENIAIIQRGLVDVEHPPRAELLVEIGSATVYSRLVLTDVESGVRCSDVLHEEKVDKKPSLEATILQLIDTSVDMLHKEPPSGGSTLHKFLLISSHETVASNFLEEIKERLPSAEIIVESDVSRSAAKHSLSRYRSMLGAACIFNVTPLNVGIAKSDGFVYTLLPRNMTLPTRQIAMFTTERPGQTQARIDVVVGITPRLNENTVIAELVLDQLACNSTRPLRIKVILDVEQDRRTHITVEELRENETVRQSITHDLRDIIGDVMDWDDVDEIVAASENSIELDEEAEEAAARWMGEVAAGALPE